MTEELDWHPFHIPGERPIWLLVTQQEKEEYRAASLFHCEHEEKEYRDRTIKGGSKQRIRQCLTCGRAVGNAAKLNPNQPAPVWDEGLTERADAQMVERRERIYEIALERTVNLETEGYADYEEYLATEQWAKKRRAVLDRDKQLCQACLTRDATEVHHLTYERIFEEPMFDLVAICRPCHQKLHRKKIAAVAAAKAKSGEIPELPH